MSKKTQRKPKKCPQTRKTMYPNENLANRGKMYIYSHDPSADIMDMHVYLCPHASLNNSHWHIGHKSYFQKSQEKLHGNTLFTTTKI